MTGNIPEKQVTLHITDPVQTEQELVIRDLRNKDHPEFADWQHFQVSLERAAERIGFKAYTPDLYKETTRLPEKPESIGFFGRIYALLRDIKAVFSSVSAFGTSTFSRYKSLNTESLDILKAAYPLKHHGRIVKGLTAYPRIELLHNITETAGSKPGTTVLEAGCGSGLNMYLLDQFTDNLTISGFEYTHARLASCIVNLANSSMTDSLFLADTLNIPLPDESYDVVFSCHVLEQLGQKNAETALEEMWRLCRKGIVVCEPSIHGAGLYEKWRMNKLGYCRELKSAADRLEHGKVILYKEDDWRTWPNTSHQLVVKKLSPG